MSRPHEGTARHEELAVTRAPEAPAGEGERHPARQTRRREMLAKGLGVAAAAVGAGAVLDLSAGTAQAASTKPGVFVSSTAGTPAVSATGANGADGVDASSDSGTGVKASSGSGTGVHGVSGTGLAGLFDGNVQVNGNSGLATSAVHITGTNGTEGLRATSDTSSGIHGEGGADGVEGVGGVSGVFGFSTGGTGVFGDSETGDGVFGSGSVGVHGVSTGLAGLFEGDVQVKGNFSATGTKNFVHAHPSDQGREIVYVALEGGEAGTYSRGTGQLRDGKAVVVLPEDFRLVTADEGLTVQLTARGDWLQLYVAELSPAQLVVRDAQDKSGLFDYFVSGVRKGYERHEVIRLKRP
jgi:hypothetical protein